MPHPYEEALKKKDKTIALLRRQIGILQNLLAESERERQQFVRNVCSCGFDSCDPTVHMVTCDYRQLVDRRLRRGKIPLLLDEIDEDEFGQED